MKFITQYGTMEQCSLFKTKLIYRIVGSYSTNVSLTKRNWRASQVLAIEKQEENWTCLFVYIALPFARISCKPWLSIFWNLNMMKHFWRVFKCMPFWSIHTSTCFQLFWDWWWHLRTSSNTSLTCILRAYLG